MQANPWYRCFEHHPYFEALPFGVFIHINIARIMGMPLLLIISSLWAMTDTSEGKQAGFSPVLPP